MGSISTLPKVLEDTNQHDLEYPDIPSIPEENENEDDSSSCASPINFPEFSPEAENQTQPLAKPYRGILKKTQSAI